MCASDKLVPMLIKTLAHLCLVTHDLDATQHFYCDVLGLKKQFEFLRKGERCGFYLEVSPMHFIEVFSTDEDLSGHPTHARIKHFCLEVENIDAVEARLGEHNIESWGKKLGADNSWQLWCRDPSGTEIEFHQYTPESTQLTGETCHVD